MGHIQKEDELGYVHSQYYMYGVGWVSRVCHSNSVIMCVHACVVCLGGLPMWRCGIIRGWWCVGLVFLYVWMGVLCWLVVKGCRLGYTFGQMSIFHSYGDCCWVMVLE